MKSRQLSFLPSLLVMPSSSSTNWPWPMVILSNQLAVIFSTHDYECLYLLHCNCVSITRCASSHLQKCQNSVSRLCRLCTRCKNVVLVQLELWTTRTALYIIITSKREFERISLTHKFWSSWKKPDFAPSHLRVFWCIACGCRICVEWSSCSFGWKTA
jgi:hypothetical protein